MQVAIAVIVAYCYGAIPFGYIAARLIHGVRLDREGTGNIGVTNAFKAGGTAAGIITVLGEISKAVVAIGLSSMFFTGDRHIAMALLYAAMVGTSFSLFLKGRGGKGSTLGGWGLFFISPAACVILLTLSFLVIKAATQAGRPGLKKIPLLLIPIVPYLVERDVFFGVFGVLTSILYLLNRYGRKDDFLYYGILKK